MCLPARLLNCNPRLNLPHVPDWREHQRSRWRCLRNARREGISGVSAAEKELGDAYYIVRKYVLISLLSELRSRDEAKDLFSSIGSVRHTAFSLI